MLVYLAGPITGLTYPVANAWRQKVADALLPSIEFLNPLRFNRDDTQEYVHLEAAFDGMKNIVRRNFHDVQRSDLILACFESCSPDNISVGSVYELAWGYSLRIPTIAVIPEHSSWDMDVVKTGHNHPYLREAVDYLTDNLDEAIRIIRVLESE